MPEYFITTKTHNILQRKNTQFCKKTLVKLTNQKKIILNKNSILEKRNFIDNNQHL